MYLLYTSLIYLVMVVRVKVDGIISWRNWRQELGTGEGEALFKLRQFSPLHLVHLVRVVLLPQGGQEALVNTLGVKDEADGEQDEHLVRLLVDLVVLIRLGREHGLGPLDVQQNVRERPDGVSVAPHHHVGKPE